MYRQPGTGKGIDIRTLSVAANHRNGEKGFTLIELLVVVTIIGILAAVVTVSVAGFVPQTNIQARAAKFSAANSGVQGYASGHLVNGVPTYPFVADSTGIVTIAATSCATATGETSCQSSDISTDAAAKSWYGSDGKKCASGNKCIAAPVSARVYTYVDLSSGTSDASTGTDLVALALVDLRGSFAGGGAVAGTSNGSPSGFRCIFDSEAASAAASNTAVRTKNGKILACRDNDPT